MGIYTTKYIHINVHIHHIYKCAYTPLCLLPVYTQWCICTLVHLPESLCLLPFFSYAVITSPPPFTSCVCCLFLLHPLLFQVLCLPSWVHPLPAASWLPSPIQWLPHLLYRLPASCPACSRCLISSTQLFNHNCLITSVSLPLSHYIFSSRLSNHNCS